MVRHVQPVIISFFETFTAGGKWSATEIKLPDITRRGKCGEEVQSRLIENYLRLLSLRPTGFDGFQSRAVSVQPRVNLLFSDTVMFFFFFSSTNVGGLCYFIPFRRQSLSLYILFPSVISSVYSWLHLPLPTTPLNNSIDQGREPV